MKYFLTEKTIQAILNFLTQRPHLYADVHPIIAAIDADLRAENKTDEHTPTDRGSPSPVAGGVVNDATE